MIKFKKAVVTGHTSGIGQGIYNYLQTQCETVGYDLSTGHDFTCQPTIINMLRETLDADLFINNVLHNQPLIADAWYQIHKNKNHTIISIGSAVTEHGYADNIINRYAVMQEYVSIKRDLEKIVDQSKNLNKLARSIVFRLGFVDTQMFASNRPDYSEIDYPDLHEFIQYFDTYKNNGHLLTVDQVVDTLKLLLDQPSNATISQITLDNQIRFLL